MTMAAYDWEAERLAQEPDRMVVAFPPMEISLVAHLPSPVGAKVSFLVGGPTMLPSFDGLSRLELSVLRTLLYEGLARLEDYREGDE